MTDKVSDIPRVKLDVLPDIFPLARPFFLTEGIRLSYSAVGTAKNYLVLRGMTRE